MKNYIFPLIIIFPVLLVGCQVSHIDLTGQTLTPAIERPLWRVGQHWEYSDGLILEVSRVADGVTRFERLDKRGDWLSRRGFLREESVTGHVKRKVLSRQPQPSDNGMFLASRKGRVTFERTFLTDGVVHVHETTWENTGKTEDLYLSGLKATLVCNILTWTSKSKTSNWQGWETWWFCPKISHYGKMEYRYGNEPKGMRVLTNFRNVAVKNADTTSK